MQANNHQVAVFFSMQCNLASIDVGTNTIRLWIGKIKTKKILTQHTDRANVRLGEGIKDKGIINKKALARAVSTLTRYSETFKKHAVQNFRAVGTSVFRKASNGKEVLPWLSKESGIPIQVISGEEEARLCVKGVLWDLPRSPDRALIVDVGGGSTELIMTRDSRIEALRSIDLGAVYLTEAYFRHDPPLEKEIKALKTYIADRLAPMTVLTSFTEPSPSRCPIIGTAGTATTLAAMDLALPNYAANRVHGHVLNINKLVALFHGLRLKKAQDRLSLPGLEPGREDIILAGLLVWIVLLKTFSCQEMTVSHTGILEGIAIDLWERDKKPCYTK